MNLRLLFQSTRPRGARPCRSRLPPPGGLVSIHAPTGGATTSNGIGYSQIRVSIHAPTGGATHVRHQGVGVLPFQSTRPRGARRGHPGRSAGAERGFNPRAHGGRDADCRSDVATDLVSIHAPTGGATRTRPGRLKTASLFQSTRPRGARPDTFRGHDVHRQFQSTRPRGARPRGARTSTSMSRFQSTRPRGARQETLQDIPVDYMFQSTRPRGARRG